MTPHRPPQPLHVLVKFFDKEEHAYALHADGLLYARRLECFRREDEGPQRGDKHEGSILLPVDEWDFSLDGHRLELGPTGEATIPLSALGNLNIFCMSLFHASPRDYSSKREILDEVVRQINDSLSVCSAMGHHAVVVTDQTELLVRVRDAARRQGYEERRGPVEYYDTYPSEIAVRVMAGGEIQWYYAFLKHRRYEKQREYRFAFDTRTLGDDPLELGIGRLDDITLPPMDIQQLANRSNWRIAR